MPVTKIYSIQKGDTLYGVAKRFYGNGALYVQLAAYNNLADPHAIRIGQKLDIPDKAALTRESGKSVTPAPPDGLDEIRHTFGDIFRFIDTDGRLKTAFENQYLTRITLPFAIPYSADHRIKLNALYGHRLLAGIYQSVFSSIRSLGLESTITSCGGCFSFRHKSRSNELSVHSWGIAVDINPETNPMGTKGNMPKDVIRVFKDHGFSWGGDWPGKRKDPMHFQYCEGY